MRKLSNLILENKNGQKKNTKLVNFYSFCEYSLNTATN